MQNKPETDGCGGDGNSCITSPLYIEEHILCHHFTLFLISLKVTSQEASY